MVGNKRLLKKAKKIKLVLTDCDGVLTDGCVYYSGIGEELKKFSLKDGMGVERLRTEANINTGIITGENNDIIKRRAEKLNIELLFCGVKDKLLVLQSISESLCIDFSEIAYIGDDINDLLIMEKCGLRACPADAMEIIKKEADYVSEVKGGNGAFRDFAELILFAKKTHKKEDKK